MKTATCECSFTATGDTTEEVTEKMREHAESAHPEKMEEMADWPQEERDKVLKEMVKDA